MHFDFALETRRNIPPLHMAMLTTSIINLRGEGMGETLETIFTCLKNCYQDFIVAKPVL
jgi:hypothetical protein